MDAGLHSVLCLQREAFQDSPLPLARFPTAALRSLPGVSPVHGRCFVSAAAVLPAWDRPGFLAARVGLLILHSVGDLVAFLAPLVSLPDIEGQSSPVSKLSTVYPRIMWEQGGPIHCTGENLGRILDSPRTLLLITHH